MKFFFNYLLEENVVSADDLVHAFVTQLQSTPSLLEILISQKKIPAEQLVSLISKQIELKQDLLTLIKQDNLLDEKSIEDILTLQSQQTKSIASILIDQGKLSQKEYLTHLHQFTGKREQIAKDSDLVISAELAESIVDNEEVKSEVEDKNGEPAVNDAALESLKELVGTGGLDESVLQELGNTDAAGGKAVESSEPEVNNAALESLKELVGTGGLDESVLQELGTTDTAGDKVVESSEPAVNDAALESLKELVGTGGLDESVLQELGNTDAAGGKAVESSEPEVNNAALESLKELVGAGGLDESVLQELGEDSSASKDIVQLSSFSGKIDSDELFLEMLFEKYSKKLHQKMIKVMELIGNTMKDGDFPKQLVVKFQKEIKEVSGMFGVIEAEPITYLSSRIEEFLLNLSNKYENGAPVDSEQQWEDIFLPVAELFWHAREAIKADGSLDKFVADSTNQELFSKILTKIG